METDPRLLTAFAEWRAAAATVASQNNKLQDLDQEVIQSLSYHPELQQEFSKTGRKERSQLPGSVTRRVREDKEVISRAARKGHSSSILHGSLLPRIQQKSERVLELIRANQKN